MSDAFERLIHRVEVLEHLLANHMKVRPKDLPAVRAMIDGSRFDFGGALRRLKDGKAVAREGWNGKNMFLLLTAPFSYNERISMPETIVMRTAQGGWVAWLPSQTDVLAGDWLEVTGEWSESR